MDENCLQQGRVEAWSVVACTTLKRLFFCWRTVGFIIKIKYLKIQDIFALHCRLKTLIIVTFMITLFFITHLNNVLRD